MILSWLQYLLVKHPTIQNFSWIPSKTLGSSFQILCFTILSYLFSTFTLSHVISLPSIPQSILKPISAIHSMSLMLLSFTMALGCTLSTFSHAPNLQWIICIPPHTPPTGPVFFWAYIFYLSKILEFVDTLLIILGKSIQRLTFLHVYHHSTAVVMCYIWLQTSQTLFPAVLVTNASVHVLMYTYYLLCALGKHPKWKKLVTKCQIIQFYSIIIPSGPMFYYHFISGSGCSGIWGWSFNVVFCASLLVLFLDFHNKNYGAGASLNMIHNINNNVKPSKPLLFSTHRIAIHNHKE